MSCHVNKQIHSHGGLHICILAPTRAKLSAIEIQAFCVRIILGNEATIREWLMKQPPQYLMTFKLDCLCTCNNVRRIFLFAEFLEPRPNGG